MEKRIFKQMLEFSKTAFDSTFTTMASFQEQIESSSKKMIDDTVWMTDSGKKALADWISASKKGRVDFKKAVDENYRKVEDFFSKQ